MFKMRDFFHINDVDALVKQIHAPEPGLMIFSGREGILAAGEKEKSHPVTGLLNSGKDMIFRTIIEEEMDLHPRQSIALVAGDERMVRYQERSGWRKVHKVSVSASENFTSELFAAFQTKPDLLLVDKMDEHNAVACFEIAAMASRYGMRMIAQMDVPYLGEDLLHLLPAWGVVSDQLETITCILTIHRVPILCRHCREVHVPTEKDRDDLIDRLETKSYFANNQFKSVIHSDNRLTDQIFYQSRGCGTCSFSGRHGDAALVEVLRQESGKFEVILPIEASLWNLILAGSLPVADILHFRENLNFKVYSQLVAAEEQLDVLDRQLLRLDSELNAVSRVLEHRNQALFSTYDIGSALTRADSIYELAVRVCRHAQEICFADRVILYMIRSGEGSGSAEMAANIGWEGAHAKSKIPAVQITNILKERSMMEYRGLPPGFLFPEIGRVRTEMKRVKAVRCCQKAGYWSLFSPRKLVLGQC